MRKYELWLDETGDFSPEEQIRGSKGDKVYSLIGGVLLPTDSISNEEAFALVGNELGHATELDKAMIRNNLVPALRTLKARGAEFVFFENQQRITSFDQKDLYMEMIVEGILQLVSFLGTFDKEFQLDIIIAVRYISFEENVLSRIPMEEYYKKLEKTLLERIRYGYMNLDDDIKINVIFSSARKEPKLMLADYTCGARRAFLREHDNRYTKADKAALGTMFDKQYIFDCYEYPLIGKVKSKLADNKLAEAILLLCDDKNISREISEEYIKKNGTAVKEKIKWLITEKMKQLGKLEVQCQIKELISDLNASIRMEDEYEWGETFLNRLTEGFLEELKKYEEYDAKLDLEIALAYSYLYLKEGDMFHLAQSIEKAESYFSQLPQCIDFIGYKVNIWILKQACAVYSYDFDEAEKWEQKVEKYMFDLSALLQLAEIWPDTECVPNMMHRESRRLKELRIFLEWREKKGDERESADFLFKSAYLLEKETFENVNLFPRGCYYHQIGEGSFMKAFSWILAFNEIELKKEDNGNIARVKECAVDFCENLLKMDGKQKLELLRDYLYLIVEMKKKEIENASSASFSSLLYQALEETRLLESVERGTKNGNIAKTLCAINKNSPYRHLIRSVLEDFQEKNYHPMEQIWWYLASYYNLCKSNENKMYDYYNRAILICEESPEYSVMRITRLLIQAERSGSKLIAGTKRGEAEKMKIKEVYNEILESDCLLEVTKLYLQKEWKNVMEMMEQNAVDKKIGRELIRLSEKMRL